MLRNTPYKDSFYEQNHSTAYRTTYDLEQSQKLYEALLQENQRLRSIARTPHTHMHQSLSSSPRANPHYNSVPSKFNHAVYSPQQLENMSRKLASSSNVARIQQSVQQPADNMIIEKICPYTTQGEHSNMALYNLNERNKYLQRKIQSLRKELAVQTEKIERGYEKARQHTGCKECYQQKYYDLLRLTSPQ